MPVFRLSEKLIFPDPSLATPEGLLAVGGDLSPERLLLAYKKGIFPWYENNSPVLWWSPDPRMVLFPDKLKISKSLRQTLRNRNYKVTFDTCFEKVIEHCGTANNRKKETWITDEMKTAYTMLHYYGFAHSAETWMEDRLVGGLYGVSLGRAFFGESMFYLERDASKTALYHLCRFLSEMNFELIDAQQVTLHLTRLGAVGISREKFLELLDKALEKETLRGNWGI